MPLLKRPATRATQTTGGKFKLALRLARLPQGYSLGASVCSYGFVMLAPNVWCPPAHRGSEGKLRRPLRLASGRSVPAEISQPAGKSCVEVRVSPTAGKLSKVDKATLKIQVVRMLRLTDVDEKVARTFARGAGKDLVGSRKTGIGRLFRSPSLFEDLVKTFTLCNCGWSRTLTMNARLCERVGGGAFPSPAELAKLSPGVLKAKCGVGYRAQRIIRLARDILRGQLDLHSLDAADSPDKQKQRCSVIFGLGPFGVANVLQLLGSYEEIPADSETARHLRQARGMLSCNVKNVRKKAEQVYLPYKPFQFLRYWTELWRTYEERMGGAACDVDPECYRLCAGPQMDVGRQPYAKKRQRA